MQAMSAFTMVLVLFAASCSAGSSSGGSSSTPLGGSGVDGGLRGCAVGPNGCLVYACKCVSGAFFGGVPSHAEGALCESEDLVCKAKCASEGGIDVITCGTPAVSSDGGR